MDLPSKLKPLLNTLFLCGTTSLAVAEAEPAVAPVPLHVDNFTKRIQPILETYCYDCHGNKKTKGKVKLTEYSSLKELERNPQLIEKMIEALDKNEMPPEDEILWHGQGKVHRPLK